MRVRLLGPVDVMPGGEAKPVSGLRRKAVLATLALHVGAVIAEIEQVTGRARDDGGLTEHGPQIRHVALQRVQRGRRRGLAPNGVHQAAGTDSLAIVER